MSALIRGKDDTTAFLEAVGQLHSLGVKISYPSGPENAIADLPSYPWHYEKSYWADTRITRNWRFRKHLPHDLLGVRTLEESDVSPTWRNVLRISAVPWLSDHCVGNDIVYPAAGYVTMVGEAIYQVNDIKEYTLKDVEISKAMVLYNDKSIEIVTNLRPQRLTSTLDSEWYEFTIVSYDGVAWNKHCSGLVRSGRASANPPKRTQSLDRKVSSSRWYTVMARVGLNYGHRFSGLKNISASVVDRIAAAEISDVQDTTESSYMMHPSTLDLVFQSLTVAHTQGIYRDFKSLFLPTYIDEIYVGDAAKKSLQINTAATGKPGTVQGASYGICADETVFFLKGFRGQAMGDSGQEKPPELKTLQLQWKPHLDFLKAGDLMELRSDIKDLIQVLERLYVLCAIETRSAIKGLTAAEPHFEKYRNWLDEQFERFSSPDYPLVEDSRDLVALDEKERQELIPRVLQQSETAGGWATANAIYRGYINAADVFLGKASYLDLLLQDGVLTGLYSWYNDIWEFKDYMQLLGHASPQLRVLEIGAGTGGLTSKFLEQLKSDYGERLYLKYTFTDISPGFFVTAKERFKDCEGIEYKALDISKDPLEQGFNAGEYDIIIASNVLHATPWLQETLTNVHTLLKPDGQLFLQELCPVTRTISYVMGPFDGWWLSEEDGRVGSPFISPEEWDRRLRLAGFSGCDSVNVDYEPPYIYMANIIAKPALKVQGSEKITLLYNQDKGSFVAEVENVLRAQEIEFELCEWGQEPPADQDIISFVDLGNKPLLQDLTEKDLAQLLETIDSFQQSNILWLTPAAQIHPTDPHAGQILGLMRTVRSELAASFVTLELEDRSAAAAGGVINLIKRIQRSKDSMDELDIDMEWAWSNGALNVGRFHWIPLDEDLRETAEVPETKGLAIGTPGLLQTLHWSSQPLSAPEPDEAHIKMTAVGLNFKDVMFAMGIIDEGSVTNGSSNFGLEGTGYITKIGSNVTNVAVGDRVMTVGGGSVGMATFIQRPANFCVKLPDQISDVEAASMPLVYVTVLMSLAEKWKLEKGQSILIHSAAGGKSLPHSLELSSC